MSPIGRRFTKKSSGSKEFWPAQDSLWYYTQFEPQVYRTQEAEAA